MVKVTYKGSMQYVRHQGTVRRTVPYHFSNGNPTEITDENDIAMFKDMAKKNPETWAIESIHGHVEKAVEKVTEALHPRKSGSK